MAGDHLREEEHMALETLLANVPQSRTVKSNSLELTPSNTPQLSPATTPANKKNRLPIGSFLHSTCPSATLVIKTVCTGVPDLEKTFGLIKHHNLIQGLEDISLKFV